MSSNFRDASVPITAPTSSTTTPDTRDPAIIALEDRFKNSTDLEVWEHCIGGRRVVNIPAIANDLANHTIVVCLDCEHWSNNTDETTEVGIATFGRQNVLPVVANGDFGDHGEHLMQQVKFYLLRTIETSHLPNQNPESRGVDGNRFGQGRFVMFAEARQILTDLFVQPIDRVPGLTGNYPIVVLGHDVGHDKNNLKSKAIAFDMDPIGTVVRYIDTQMLARDKGYWMMPRNEQIGLKRLVEELGFEHSDSHTAANDAGRTLISAFQIVLGGHPCKKFAFKSMKQVADNLECYSVASFGEGLGGAEKYCWKCGTVGHMKADCRATGLHCNECAENGCEINPGNEHVTMHCLCIANKKALVRREKDAAARALKRPKVKIPTRGGFHSNWGRPQSRSSAVRPPGPLPRRGGFPQYYGPPGGYGFVLPSSGGNPSSTGFGGHGGRGGHGSFSLGRGRSETYPPGRGQGLYYQG
jgi:hypothetical protein